MSAIVYACPWWCTAVDHPRRGVYELDDVTEIGAVIHRALFPAVPLDGAPHVEVLALDNADEPPCLVVCDAQSLYSEQARELAAALMSAADLLDQCAGVAPLPEG